MEQEINKSLKKTDKVSPMPKQLGYTTYETGYCYGFDGNKVYYEVHGTQGPYVILVYGVACLMNHWIYQTTELSKTHRVVLFDYRGHHKSENHPNLGMDYVAHDIKCLMEHLKVEKAHLVGHSFGVPVVVKFNKLYPENTNNIVLINGFVYNPLDEIFKFPVSKKLISLFENLSLSAPHLSQWLWKKAVNNILSQIGAGLLGGFNLERTSFKDIEIYTQGLENLNLKVVLAYMNEILNLDLRDDLQDLTARALVVSGLRDGITPTHQQDLMKALIPEAEIVKFAEGSHCTQLDIPEQLNPVLRGFLT